MPDLGLQDAAIQSLLQQAKVIAVVGHSDKPSRISYQIGEFLRSQGYTVYPVNPSVAEIAGQPSYPSLADVPEPVDIVNVFRRSDYLPEVVTEAIAIQAKAIWAQLGVKHPQAIQLADTANLDFVMNRCIKIEHQRLIADSR